MRYLTVDEVVALHQRVLDQSGGSPGLRDDDRLRSAVAQPASMFGGMDLYPSLSDKAGALGYSLIQGHAFVDGNKRIGHLAIETFLVLNGYEIEADVDEQERIVLAVAAGTMKREEFTTWLQARLAPRR